MSTAKVLVKRINARKYELYLPGETVACYTRKTQREARALAYTLARYKLKNQSMFEACCVTAEGWSP